MTPLTKPITRVRINVPGQPAAKIQAPAVRLMFQQEDNTAEIILSDAPYRLLLHCKGSSPVPKGEETHRQDQRARKDHKR